MVGVGAGLAVSIRRNSKGGAHHLDGFDDEPRPLSPYISARYLRVSPITSTGSMTSHA